MSKETDPTPPRDEKDPKLTGDVKIGVTTFRKGVHLSTLVSAARRWHELANAAMPPIDQEAAAELKAMMGVRAEATPPAASDLEIAADFLWPRFYACEEDNQEKRETLIADSGTVAALAALLAAARAEGESAERERCAKIAAKHLEHRSSGNDCAVQIVSDIRKP